VQLCKGTKKKPLTNPIINARFANTILILILFQFIVFGVMHIKSTVLYYDFYYFIFAIIIGAVFLHYTIEVSI
jgi:hypothetical protein